MMTDPIADMLTRLRNGALAHKAEVVVPYSRLKHEIAKLLARESYLMKVEKLEGTMPELRLVLKYRSNGEPHLKHVRRVSVPSRRVYVTRESLPRVLNDYGIAVISSSRGILTNKEARKARIGGELLLEIW